MVSSVSNSIGSLSSSNITKMAEKLLKKIDTNQDGSVSREEFLSNRPKDMSEAQADKTWSDLDTSNTGSLTGSEFLSAMQNRKPPQGPPPDGMGDIYGSTGSKGQSLNDLFGKIDTDGNGSVTKDEFLSSLPDDVSEKQAEKLWNSLDTENTGSLTQDQFVTAMQNQRKNQGPPPGPPPGDSGSSTSTDPTSTSSSDTANEMLQALKSAINKYTLTMNQSDSSTQNASGLSTLLSSIG